MPAWSYSALQLFETCPRKFQALRVTKEVKEPEGEALRWGNYLHKQFEEYINSRGKYVLPQELNRYRALLDAVLAHEGEKFCEYSVALTQSLTPTTFFGKDVWTRGKLDVLILNGKTAYVLDWKTGKPKPDASQVKLFALYVFALFPDVEEVKAGFVWVADGVTNAVEIYTYLKSDTQGMWNEFLPRIKLFEDAHATNNWPVRPSGLCKAHCPVVSCPHNGNKR